MLSSFFIPQCLEKIRLVHGHDWMTILLWQPWRAATLCPFGGFNLFPSLEVLEKNGKNRMLQAIELESGVGHQWHLWKWATYCASEVSKRESHSKFLWI